jgi:hypothetical protein
MMPNLPITIILPFSLFWIKDLNLREPLVSQRNPEIFVSSDENPFPIIGSIPIPAGFTRTSVAKYSFGEWLRTVSLKKSKTVYLYNGLPKSNQTAQFAVLNISVTKKDLQQCADAIMRLRAEYLYSQKRYKEIVFQDNNNRRFIFGPDKDRQRFDHYLEKVFSYCGTASLEKQLNPVNHAEEVQIGDVLIQGGFPGHAMLIVDMATNNRGERIYMLAQSFMPAQDIHIVVNPASKNISPWYRLNNSFVFTPFWTFPPGKIKTW